MLISGVRECPTRWELSGQAGEILQLPRLTTPDREILIGTAGTRRAVKVKGKLTEHFARMLAVLPEPIMLIDVRRTGIGGSGSWGPEEFATIIPGLLAAAGVSRYSFHHVPLFTPSRALLDKSKRAAKIDDNLSEEQIKDAVRTVESGEEPQFAAWKHWEVYRAAYRRELSTTPAILAARAFVEAANEQGGIAVFLCAEERRDNFDEATRREQDNCHCHRFRSPAELPIRSVRRFLVPGLFAWTWQLGRTRRGLNSDASNEGSRELLLRPPAE